MAKCEKCGGKGYIEVEDVTVYPKTLTRMICTECERKPMTNFDRIKNMTIDEMAKNNVYETEIYFITSDLDEYPISRQGYEDALHHEIEWLSLESKEATQL